MKQLFDTVKSLCAAMDTLTSNMNNMMKTVSQISTTLFQLCRKSLDILLERTLEKW